MLRIPPEAASRENRLKYFRVGFIPLNTALETGLEILVVSRTFIRSEIPISELRIEAFGLLRHQVMKSMRYLSSARYFFNEATATFADSGCGLSRSASAVTFSANSLKKVSAS